MNWFKKAWQTPAYRGMTFFILGIGILSPWIIKVTDIKYYGTIMPGQFTVLFGCLGLYVVILGITYLKRNSE